jgi:hypothetical protein
MDTADVSTAPGVPLPSVPWPLPALKTFVSAPANSANRTRIGEGGAMGRSLIFS